jgi:hypothetical protein
MRFSKIASKTTYHKCLRELSNWKYIDYSPSHSQYRGSKISLSNFWTTVGQPVDKQWTSTGQPLVSNTNIYKHNSDENENIGKGRTPKIFLEVFDFLKSSDCAKNISSEKLKKEAQKFFNHYSANGWKIGGKTPMEYWKPAAENWLLKSAEFEKNDTNTKTSDHLHTKKSKNYNQPL